METRTLNKDFEIKHINGVPYFQIPMKESIDGTNSLPQFDLNTEYEEKNTNLQSCNESIIDRIEAIDKEIQEIKKKLGDCEKNKSFKSKTYKIHKKRDRRKSNEIRKIFKCGLCPKSYG